MRRIAVLERGAIRRNRPPPAGESAEFVDLAVEVVSSAVSSHCNSDRLGWNRRRGRRRAERISHRFERLTLHSSVDVWVRAMSVACFRFPLESLAALRRRRQLI